MIIAPTNAIHTFFMKFPIDVIFAAKDGTIVKVRPALGPWGIAVALRGHAVIEMMAGTLNVAEIRKGDRVLVGRTAAGVRDSAT